jgi:hypothetical protein
MTISIIYLLLTELYKHIHMYTYIGDSRCVMLKSYDMKDALSLSSISEKTKNENLKNENKNENENENGKNNSVLLKRQESEGLANIAYQREDKLKNTRISHSVQSFFPTPQPSSSSNKEKKNNRFVAVHLMSEDHKLNVSYTYDCMHICYFLICLINVYICI